VERDSDNDSAEPARSPAVMTTVDAAPPDRRSDGPHPAPPVRSVDRPARRSTRRRFVLAAALVLVMAGAVTAFLLARTTDEAADPGVIVFASARDGDHELFTMKPDGSALQQLTDNDIPDIFPDWSPDSSQLVWTQGPDIVAANADGSAPRNLTEDIADTAEKPVWSPDGSAIVFVRTVAGHYEIWKMSADGSDKSAIVTYAEHHREAFDPIAGAEGSLFYSSRHSPTHVELCRTTVAEGDCRPVLPSNASNITDEVIAVAPDGNTISFSRSVDAVNYDVMVSDLSGGAVIDVTLQAEAPIGPGSSAPAGTDPPRDLSSNDYGSSWSPDGESLVMVRQPAGADAEIWVRDRDGRFIQLTDNTVQDIDPDWARTPG
jgi:Tol biopolymer transport system component